MAAITKPQVDLVVSTLASAHRPFSQLEQFALAVQTLMANNWVSTTTIGGINGSIKINSTVSGADQTTLLNQYQTLKTNLTTIINQLP